MPAAWAAIPFSHSMLYCRASSQPRSMAKQSMPSVPFSCIAIARPTAIQREGWSVGMPIGSSGPMPLRRETFWIYASVLFSFGGAQRLMMPRMV